MGTFKYAGVSRRNGQYKVRFCNDLIRVKVLATQDGDIDINFVEMPEPMEKPAIVTYLLSHEMASDLEVRMAIEVADEKYNGVKTVKAEKVKTALKTGGAKTVKAGNKDAPKKETKKPKKETPKKVTAKGPVDAAAKLAALAARAAEATAATPADAE